MPATAVSQFIVRVTVAYAVFASFWILISDSLLSLYVSIDDMMALEISKGILFIIVTTALLFMSLQYVRHHVANVSPQHDVKAGRSGWQLWSQRSGYIFAFLITIADLMLRAIIVNGDPLHRLQLIMIMPAILLSALLGGAGPGLLSTAMTLVFILLAPYAASHPDRPFNYSSNAFQLTMLVVSGVLSSLLSDLLHRSRRKAQQQSLYSTMALASIGDAVIATDNQQRITLINPVAEMLTGCPAQQAIGQHLINVYSCHAVATNDSAVKTLHTHWLQPKQGDAIAISETRNAILWQKNELGTVIVFRDETERVQAQLKLKHSQELLNAIVEGSTDAIFVKNNEGRYILCNSAAAKVVNKSVHEIIGHDDFELFSEADARLLQSNDNATKASGKTQTHEEDLRDPNGRLLTFLATKGPVIDPMGHIVGVFGISRDISERQQQQILLNRQLDQLRRLIEQSPYSIAMLDCDLRYLVVSNRWLQDYGRSHDNIIGLRHYDVHPDIPEGWKADHQRALKGEFLQSSEDFWQQQDGVKRWLRRATQPWFDASNQIAGIVISAEDITAQHNFAEEMKIAAVAFESDDAMLITDGNGVILRVNRAYSDITGYSAEEAIGNRQGQLVKSGKQDTEFYQGLWNTLKERGVWRGELWNRRKNGELYPELLSITGVKDSTGMTTHYVGVMQDITLRKQSEETIQRLAFYDPLTNLPNRRLLMDRLQQALLASMRNNEYGALFFIDLDNFKTLNDTLGHHIGDLLLIDVARRLQADLRQTDTVARLGGDEFVVMMENLSPEPTQAAALAKQCANKIVTELGAPYTLDTHLWHSTPSIGISLFKTNELPIDVIMKQADLALYQAKAEGKNTLRFFDPVLQQAVEKRSSLESDLYQAAVHQQFVLFYQAQVDRNNHIVGFESLMRWIHPHKGIVPPNEFIPLAEETGLILVLGSEALRQACQQLARWAEHTDSAHLTLAVNVSAKQFRADEFVDTVRHALDESGANPKRLKLELTESLLLDHIERAIAKMHELRELGICFSLDDFGTGYSSLAYLKQLPLEQIKIDRSFVTEILNDSSDAVIAHAIIALAHSLDLIVVAEGVETSAQWDFLLHDRCDIGQGYLFSKPLPIEQVAELIKQNRA